MGNLDLNFIYSLLIVAFVIGIFYGFFYGKKKLKMKDEDLEKFFYVTTRIGLPLIEKSGLVKNKKGKTIIEITEKTIEYLENLNDKNDLNEKDLVNASEKYIDDLSKELEVKLDKKSKKTIDEFVGLSIGYLMSLR